MDPDLVRKLVALPWTLQLVLGSGYCAYLLAYVGIRHDHKAADTVFSTLAFGLIAVGAMTLTSRLIDSAQAVLTFLATLTAGALWRTVLRDGLRRVLRASGYSWNDGTPSAWARLLQEQHTPTQLTVQLKDGRYLLCTDTTRVKDVPFGPYVLGWAGDALLYVDRSIAADGKVSDLNDTFNDDWGNLLTYVPRDEIRKVSIRYLNRPSGSAEATPDVAAGPAAAG